MTYAIDGLAGAAGRSEFVLQTHHFLVLLTQLRAVLVVRHLHRLLLQMLGSGDLLLLALQRVNAQAQQVVLIRRLSAIHTHT